MTKRVLAVWAVLAAVAGAGLAVGGGAQEVGFASHGAIVLNWGVAKEGRYMCNASCGEALCIVDGKLALHVTSSGKAGFNCNDALWTLEPPPPGGMHGTINCGEFGYGLVRVTPSLKANFYCHN